MYMIYDTYDILLYDIHDSGLVVHCEKKEGCDWLQFHRFHFRTLGVDLVGQLPL
jgi:hypothetical protein